MPLDDEVSLSVNVDRELSDRLQNLADVHDFSESAIVHVALTMFFSRGDDTVLALLLDEHGAVGD